MSLILPSYQSGFAPRDYKPAYPSLWRGCVGAWAPCLGPTGLVLRDAVGKNDGVLTNGPTWQISGGKYALEFDGSNDYVSIASLTPALGFSFACWFKAVNASRTRQSIFSNAADNSPDIYLHLESVSGTSNAMNFYDGGGYLGTSTTFTQDTNWHHYAWTTSASGVVKYYRDGLSLGSPANWTIIRNDNSASATIGAVVTLINNGFTAEGQMDDCRRYSRTLTDNEIRLLASRRGIGYDYKTHRSYSKTQSSGLLKRLILTGQT